MVSFSYQLPFVQIHWISYRAVTGHDLFLFLVMMPEILHLKVGLQYPCSEKAFILFAVQHRDSKLHVGRHKEPSSVECSLPDILGYILFSFSILAILILSLTQGIPFSR